MKPELLDAVLNPSNWPAGILAKIFRFHRSNFFRHTPSTKINSLDVSGLNCSYIIGRILQVNVQSLPDKIQNFKIILQDLKPQLLVVLLVSEHWMTQGQVECLLIPGYHLAAQYCRTIHIHGGVAIYSINKKENIINLDRYLCEFSCKCLAVSLKLS